MEGRVSNFLNTHVKKMNQNQGTALPIDARGLFTVPESGKAYQTEASQSYDEFKREREKLEK